MESVKVLAVASSPTTQQLRRILTHSRWTLFEAPTISQTLAELRRLPLVVLICESVLPDGNWHELLRQTLRLPIQPPLVVVAGHADESLWMDVLNRGGYNLLGIPFEDQQVFQVVSQAWLHLLDLAKPTLSV